MPYAEPKPITKSAVTLTHGLIAQLRSEKARVCEKTGHTWNYETLIRAMLLHWQAYPPAQLPDLSELREQPKRTEVGLEAA